MTRDREELTLRTAAAIQDLLSDNDAHSWRECIDRAQEHVPTRRLAGQVAWAALTEFIDPNHDVLWGGEKGARWLALYDEDRAREVACPTCGAEAGSPCAAMNGHGGTRRAKAHAHDERQTLAYVPVVVDAASRVFVES